MTGHTPAEKERLVLIMKKTYKIEVDCANCAQKMEDAANTVAGVAKATVSFMTQKLSIEIADENFDSVWKEVKKKAKKANPDVTILD